MTAKKNPMSVAIPAYLPPRSKASGIIELASIFRIAPPAIAWINESHCSDVCVKRSKPVQKKLWPKIIFPGHRF